MGDEWTFTFFNGQGFSLKITTVLFLDAMLEKLWGEGFIRDRGVIFHGLEGW